MAVILASTVSAYDASALWAQWVGSVAAVLSVGVAIVFGYLTLANTRRSKDAQERATIAAAAPAPQTADGQLAAAADLGDVRLSVRAAGGERWELRNDGPDTAYAVRISGLTSLDQRRLEYVGNEPEDLAPGQTRQFVLVSRLALGGPANVVVQYRLHEDSPDVRQVLLVPAP
jgi:hypothetical protein